MKIDRLADLVGDYLMKAVAPKMISPVTKFVFGAAASGPGKKAIERSIAPYVSAVTADDGEVDLDALRELVSAGLKASGPVPLLRGLVTVDASDVAPLFEFVKAADAAPAAT